MSKFYPELTDDLCDFISRQHLFFTATAAGEGRVNLSPKGMDSFRRLDNRTVTYLDVTGSGNETAAHLRRDGRLTIMFCSFDTQPLILRLYGQGRVIHPRDADWNTLARHFPPLSGSRQIMVMNLESAQTSCGYGVPLYHYEGERGTLLRWAEKKGTQGLADYWRDKNQISIDGLPTHLLED